MNREASDVMGYSLGGSRVDFMGQSKRNEKNKISMPWSEHTEPLLVNHMISPAGAGAGVAEDVVCNGEVSCPNDCTLSDPHTCTVFWACPSFPRLPLPGISQT